MAKIPFITRYNYEEPEYKSDPGEHVVDDSQYISDAELITGLLTGVRQVPPARKLYYGLKYDEDKKQYVGTDRPLPVYSVDVADVPGDGEMASLEENLKAKEAKLVQLEADIAYAKKQKAKKSEIEKLQAQIDELKSGTPKAPPTTEVEETDSK